MPVKALRSEMTTGMSAPPIGSTNSTPNARAPRMIATSSASFSTPATIATPRPMSTASRRRLPYFWPGYVIGRPVMSSWSFAKAIMLPAKETAPMSAERTIATETFRSRSPGSAIELWKSASAMSAAAPPPTPLNSATICGIAVIFTARAAYAPIGAVMAMTRITQTN